MKRPTVLIVDDDQLISEGARIRLRAAGFDPIAVDNGADGLEIAQRCLPEAIVLDVRMPNMDGLAVLNELKRNAATRQIPVVMLSASIVDQEAALEGGARFFIRKPFDGKSLVEAVRAASLETPGHVTPPRPKTEFHSPEKERVNP